MTNRLPVGGRSRAIVEAVEPEVGDGRFSAKSAEGEWVDVEADAFTDGHDSLRCVLRYKHDSEDDWREAEMQHLGNDRWHARFPAERLG
ncbi:MAG: maltotransferase domain-containing protein, partial [Gemmatimonadota bacterium]